MAFTPFAIGNQKGSPIVNYPGSAPTPASAPSDSGLPTPGRSSFANLKYNLGKVPGELLNIGDMITSGTGGDFAAAIGAPAAADQQMKLAEQDKQYVSTILGLRNKAKASGADTSHWDTLIRNYHPVADPSKTLQDMFPALAKSNEQVVGDFAGLAANIASAGSLETGVKGAAKPAVGWVQGALQGAKAGAKSGGFIGAMQGFASGLKNNGTAQDVIASTGQQAIGGALGGAAVGGVIGAATALPKPKVDKVPNLDETIKIVSPKATPVAGAKDIASGKGVAPTMFGKGQIDHSETPYIQKAAEDVRGLVSSKNSMIENVNSVHDGIKSVATDTVKPYLTKNKVPFNFEDLQISLSQVNPSSSLKSDPNAFNTYSRVKEEIQQALYNELKKGSDKGSITDMNELWDARKAIDTKISQELGDATFGTPQYTGVKAAARDMRTAVNDFISNSIGHPGQMEQVNAMHDFLQTARSRGMDISTEADAMKALGEQFGLNMDAGNAKAAVFKDALSRMNGMYDAISNMAPKAYDEVGKTGLNLLLKKHPVLKKIIGAGLTGVGLGAGFKGAEAL